VSSYPVAKLGDVVEINPGLPRGLRPSDATPISFVPMAAVSETSGAIVTMEERPFGKVSLGFTLFANNDVLFAKITPCMENGKAAIARNLSNGQGAGSTEFFVLRPKSTVLPEFIYYFIRRASFRARCKANFTGSAGQQRVPKFYLEKVPLRLPPLEEQQRTVELLDRAAEIRRRADTTRAKARAIIPALFLDTFGDPGINPKDWPIVPLGDVVKCIVGGKNLKAGNGTSTYRIMKVSAVTSGVLRPDESKPAPDEHRPSPDHHVWHGDFLFSRANTSELVGAVALAHNPPPGLLLPDKIWRIAWNPELILPRFAYSLLRTSEIRRVFAVIGSGTSDSMKNISQAKLLRVRIPLPPIELQRRFAQQADLIEALARSLDAVAAKAEAMGAALSAEFFEARPGERAGAAPQVKPEPEQAAAD
jgi:type I restriction enzyme S subunit